MTWTLYNLATNPDVFLQCQDEVDSVLHNAEELTVSSISLLTYTEAVLKESLRYHQPVGTLLRTAVEDNTLVASNGKHIRVRKGTDIMIDLHILHR
jgi:cytochrome P450